ncbi:ring finger domain-containing protein [Pochonia chlamydosporia 170]|uniref:Ring finger domain-containing protein n=1 Tax=Pochonia chlamydosporia 170 TaxID=1380566 RepID=A0A179G9M8_METCM|nr:ring finger domain-containing protein [Pochonia chlamydosporia 170]OAQ74093.2 ring finger domain-containing protein [Pochonia chlamydosporia 170]
MSLALNAVMQSEAATAATTGNGDSASHPRFHLVLTRRNSVICLDVLRDEDMVRHLPCQHYFHSSCLDTWYLRQHQTCPLCKTPIFKEAPKKVKKAPESSGSAVANASSQ